MSQTRAEQLAKISKKIEGVYFSYDDLHIFGVLNNKVYVIGYYYDENDPDGNQTSCILLFSKELFKETLNLWLTDKEKYCERYQEFCGVMGTIKSVKFNITNTEVNHYDETLEVIEVFSIENNCDMEHG